MPSIQEGGIEHFLLNYLKNINLNMFQIDILSQEPRYELSEKKFTDLGCNIFLLPPKKKRFFYHLREAKRIIKQYDVVHVHLSNKSFWYLRIAKKCGIERRICHAHEARGYTGIKKILYSFYSHLTNKYTTLRLACGEKAGEFCYKGKNFQVIPNAIEVGKFCYNQLFRDEIRNMYNISNEQFLIGNIGRLSEQKNQIFLLNLMKSIEENVTLMIVGEGEKKEHLLEFCHTNNLKNVIFVNPTNEIYKYYSAFDCFALPSLYEGFPVTGVEAQSSGLLCYFSDKVSKEINLTDCDFLPIDDAVKWSYIVHNKRDDDTRISINKQIENTNYNIKKAASILYDLYYIGDEN